jgi:hypothetical protein
VCCPLFTWKEQLDVRRTIDEATFTEPAAFPRLQDEGLMECKTLACDLLLAQRVEQKMSGSKV